MQDFKPIIEYIELLALPSTSFQKIHGLQELVTEWQESFEHVLASIKSLLSSKLHESRGGLDWDVIGDVTPEREKEIEQEKIRKKTSMIKKIEDQTDWIAVKQIVKNIVSIVTDDVKENEYQFSIMIYSNPNGEVKFGEMQFTKEEIEIEDQLGIPVAIVHNSSWNRSQQIANKIHREFLEFRVEMNENYNIFMNELHFNPA